MVIEKLSVSLKTALQKIAKSIFVDEKLINELVKDIQRALLQADVDVKLVFDLTNRIRERIKKEIAPEGLTKKELLINSVYETLIEFLGREQYKIEIKQKPLKIMLLGLFGSGKTSTSGKIGKYFTKKGYKVALLGLDTHRPAAMEQIEQVAKQANIPCLLSKTEKNALKIYNEFKNEYKKYDIVIIDTAGRDALSAELIKEIESLDKDIQPEEKLLVISADIGQAAKKQAMQFHESCGITGMVVTKMDGTAKGGGTLTACTVANAPVVFIGTGEKISDLEQFNPKGFVSRLLGMGDLEGLLEKAKEAIKEKDAEDLGKKFLKGEFNLLDLYKQISAMKKMGSLQKIIEMLPGFSSLQLPKEMLNVQEEKLEKWEIAMRSMTKEELENPEIMERTRIERISRGSGISTGIIREMIKQYKQSKKLVKMFKGSKADISKFVKKFGSRLPVNY